MCVIPSLIFFLKVLLLLFWRVYLWWISLQHPTDSGRWILMQSAILLSERVTSDYNPVLSYFLPITTFQWVSRILHLAFVAFFQPLLIAIPGQILVHPGWVICAIWINGSELLDPACFDFESDISSRWKRAMSAKTVTENVWMDVLLTVCFIELIWESRFYL